jgi:TonB family protein
MRRMILTSLVLLPVLAHAQASPATEPMPSASSATLAELTLPTLRAAVKPAAVPSLNKNESAQFHQSVATKMTASFADDAMRKGGTLEYAMFGDVPSLTSTPQVTRAVEVELSPKELAAQPQVSNVVVRATVDQYGFPRNLTVAQSAGSLVDKRAVEAVSQYRFKPASRDNQPIDANVLITIKIQKP